MKKILVVDDNTSILEMVRFFLESAGYEVQISVNGTYFQQVHREWPNLILLDILLSEEDEAPLRSV